MYLHLCFLFSFGLAGSGSVWQTGRSASPNVWHSCLYLLKSDLKGYWPEGCLPINRLLEIIFGQ